MENKKDNKKLLTILIPVVVIAVIAIVAFFFFGKEEGYRLIQVYEVNGQATIEREDIGNMDAYENLNLVSGDRMTTMLESYTRLKLDDDKYLLAEEDSIIELIATGDDKSSKTNINLLKGAVTIEIENKLNEDSTFEVTTPNAVMAVRGTVFRVVSSIYAGKPTTTLSVLQGTVNIKNIDKNGKTIDEKLVIAGKEARAFNENGKEQIIISDKIDVSSFSLESLYFLREIVEDGRELSIPAEELTTVIDLAERLKNTINDTEVENSEVEETETEEVGSEDAKKDDNSLMQNISRPNLPQINTSQIIPPQTEVPEEKNVYTVTFTYKDILFGSQEIEEGELASKPTLLPAPSGHWDFDFTTPITGDLEIKFVE